MIKFKTLRDREHEIIDKYDDVDKCYILILEDIPMLDVTETKILNVAKVRMTIKLKNGKEYHNLTTEFEPYDHLDDIFKKHDKMLDTFLEENR